MIPNRFSGLLTSSVLFAATFLAALGLTRAVVAQERSGVLVGKRAPEFHIQGIYNEAYSLEKFKGHILVMQFGASW